MDKQNVHNCSQVTFIPETRLNKIGEKDTNVNNQFQRQEVTVSNSQDDVKCTCISSGLISKSLLKRIGRAVFACIDLDVIVKNLSLLKTKCRNTEIIVLGVVKGNAYSHGAVPVSRYLKQSGAVDRLAVANITEAIQLRRAGIEGVIHVLGSVQSWQMDECIQYQLVPTVDSEQALRGMEKAICAYKTRIVLEDQRKYEHTVVKHEEQKRQIKITMGLSTCMLREQEKELSNENCCQLQQTSEMNNHTEHCPKIRILHDLSNIHARYNSCIKPPSRKLEELSQQTVHSNSTPAFSEFNSEVFELKEKSYQHVTARNGANDVTASVENDVMRKYRNEDICNSQNKPNATLRYASGLPVGTVHIKVDTGMSRYGCPPQELDFLVQLCREIKVPLEGIFSHFSNLRDPIYSQHQLDTFRECTENYKDQGLILHIANSGSVIRNIGTDLNMIRPGLVAFGMTSGMNLDEFVPLGFQGAMTIKGTPDLVKRCCKGTKVGYFCAYTCPEDEWIATFSVGYSDIAGLDINYDESYYIIRDRTGEKCPVVGRISMDSLTVRVPEKTEPGELFTLISADYDLAGSSGPNVTEMQITAKPIDRKYLLRISSRMPRVYKQRTSNHSVHSIWSGLDLDLSIDQ